MAERQLLQDGTTKRIFSTDKDDQLIFEFKDAATIFDGEKKAKFKNKGSLKNALSKTIFEYLEGYNIPTHFGSQENGTEMRVKKLEMIPLTVMVRNVAAGSLCERFNVEEGRVLEYPVLEYYLKNEDLNNQMISESHAYAFGYATPDEMKHISRLASKVNAVLKSYFERRSLKLIDYRLEFGRFQKQVYLADEFSPDSCRIWDIEDGNKLNKKRFRFENSKAEESYKEIYQRLIGS